MMEGCGDHNGRGAEIMMEGRCRDHDGGEVQRS